MRPRGLGFDLRFVCYTSIFSLFNLFILYTNLKKKKIAVFKYNSLFLKSDKPIQYIYTRFLN